MCPDEKTQLHGSANCCNEAPKSKFNVPSDESKRGLMDFCNRALCYTLRHPPVGLRKMSCQELQKYVWNTDGSKPFLATISKYGNRYFGKCYLDEKRPLPTSKKTSWAVKTRKPMLLNAPFGEAVSKVRMDFRNRALCYALRNPPRGHERMKLNEIQEHVCKIDGSKPVLSTVRKCANKYPLRQKI